MVGSGKDEAKWMDDGGRRVLRYLIGGGLISRGGVRDRQAVDLRSHQI